MFVYTRNGDIADKQTRYDTSALRAALGQIEDFHACMSANCSSGQIQEDAENNPKSGMWVPALYPLPSTLASRPQLQEVPTTERRERGRRDKIEEEEKD